MKLVTPHERPPRIQARRLIERPPANEPLFDPVAFLGSPEVAEVRRLMDVGATAQGECRTLVNSYWIGTLDPRFLEQLRKVGGFKEMVIKQVKDIFDVQQLHPRPTINVAADLEHLSVLFPEERENFPQYSGEDLLAQMLQEKLTHPFERVVLAFSLIRIWPQQRERILHTVLLPEDFPPQAALWLVEREDFYEKKDFLTFFLLLFPSSRSALQPYIDSKQKQFKVEAERFRLTDWGPQLYLWQMHCLAVLGASQAYLDEEGREHLEFQTPLNTATSELPDRQAI